MTSHDYQKMNITAEELQAFEKGLAFAANTNMKVTKSGAGATTKGMSHFSVDKDDEKLSLHFQLKTLKSIWQWAWLRLLSQVS